MNPKSRKGSLSMILARDKDLEYDKKEDCSPNGQIKILEKFNDLNVVVNRKYHASTQFLEKKNQDQ